MIRWLSGEKEAEFQTALRFDPVQDACLSTLSACFFSLREYADFWIQQDENHISVSALTRFGRVGFASVSSRSDLRELVSFCQEIGLTRLELNEPERAVLPDLKMKKSRLFQLSFSKTEKPDLKKEKGLSFSPKLEQIYSLLCRSQPGFSDTISEEQWIWETSLRIRRGKAVCAALCRDGEPVSSALVYAMDEKTALLGSVVTLPEYRGRGYAAAVIGALCDLQIKKGRTVVLSCETLKLAQYYQRLGFQRIAPLLVLELE